MARSVDASGSMEAHGEYDRHSLAQHSAGSYGTPLLERALRDVTLPGSGVITVGDLGAAGGTNELAPMSVAARALRARAANPIAVVHTDIPTNDFTTLFENVEQSPDTYLATADVFPFAAGRSFYRQIFPPGSVSLVWSAIAVHWLSRVPVSIPDHLYCSFAHGAARDAFRTQSAEDWNDFLHARAIELHAGAQMVIVGGAASDDGASGAEALMDALHRAVRRAVDAGDVTADEYARMNVPTWNRTLAEFAAPFAPGGAAAAGDLTLVECSLVEVPDAYLTAYRADDDAAVFADAVSAFVRAFTEPSLFGTLDRPTAERDALAVRVYTDVREQLAADPRSFETVWRVALLR
ncbi:MAG: hypothetical protein ACHQIG_13560, partial [Acidimicrobiia bacterium]